MLIAVYGTLKKGHYNSPLMDGNFIENAVIPYFQMFSLGAFPAIVPSKKASDTIHAEIYNISEASYKRIRNMELRVGYLEIDQPIRNFSATAKIYIFSSYAEISKYSAGEIEDGIWRPEYENFSYGGDEDVSDIDDIKLDYDLDDDDNSLDDYIDDWMGEWEGDNDYYDYDNHEKHNDPSLPTYPLDPTIPCKCSEEGIKSSWEWDTNLQFWRCQKCNDVQ